MEQNINNQSIEKQNITKPHLSTQELIALINDSEEDFMISIHLGEEADTDAEEEQIQG
jgi:hypothetical protein